MIKKEAMLENQIIELKSIIPASRYRIISDILCLDFQHCFNQKYNNIFPNNADPRYHHIRINILQPPLVDVTQLPSVFTCNDQTLHHVINAKNACQNSCIKVTNKFTG